MKHFRILNLFANFVSTGAYSGCFTTQRTGIHPRVSRLFDNDCPVRPEDGSGAVALPFRGSSKSADAVPTVPGDKAVRHRCLVSHHSAEHGTGDRQPPIRYHSARRSS